MKESGKDMFLIDGFPRSEGNVSSWNIIFNKNPLKGFVNLTRPKRFFIDMPCIIRVVAVVVIGALGNISIFDIFILITTHCVDVGIVHEESCMIKHVNVGR